MSQSQICSGLLVKSSRYSLLYRFFLNNVCIYVNVLLCGQDNSNNCNRKPALVVFAKRYLKYLNIRNN